MFKLVFNEWNVFEYTNHRISLTIMICVSSNTSTNSLTSSSARSSADSDEQMFRTEACRVNVRHYNNSDDDEYFVCQSCGEQNTFVEQYMILSYISAMGENKIKPQLRPELLSR